MHLRSTRLTNRLFAILFAFDLLAIGVHVGYRLAIRDRLNVDWLRNYMLSFEIEGSYPNLYLHAKELLVVLLLVFILIRVGGLIYLNWSLVFAFVFVDDAFAVHEKVGTFITDRFQLPTIAGNGPINYLGAVYFLLLGVWAVAITIWSYARTNEQGKLVSQHLLAAIFMLAVFGIGLDVVDQVIRVPGLQGFLKLIEESGEVIMFTLVPVYVVFLAAYGTPPLEVDLVEVIRNRTGRTE